VEGNAETPDVAPTADSQPVLLPSALGRSVLHQALPGARSPELRTGRGCLVDYGKYNRSKGGFLKKGVVAIFGGLFPGV
jgi:hypothetical protein